MRKKLVLLGLDFNSENLGCSALSYSFMQVLDNIAEKNNIFFDITSVNYNLFECENSHYKIRTLKIGFKNLDFLKKYKDVLKSADYVVDFTGGDSFTDIYGMSRYMKETLLKEMVIRCKKPFIMGPQTIGPFHNLYAIKKAKYILKKSKKVYVRDEISEQYVKDTLKSNATLTTDIAFLLPKEKMEIQKSENKNRCIGINVSALMWYGGYKGDNEFGLSFNYKEYCEKIIEKLLVRNMDIHLISHVITRNADARENDYGVAMQLKKKYPSIKVAPKFNTPMEAKGYISEMEVFIGSRMHATIGAFSSGIPTIPVAYSRKFEGLYNSLGYHYVIDAKKEKLEDAVDKTLTWIDNSDELTMQLNKSRKLAFEKCDVFIKDLEKIIV